MSPVKKTPEVACPMSLEEFGAKLDDVLLYESRFARSVVGYRRGTDEIARMSPKGEYGAAVYAAADQVVGSEGYVRHGNLKVLWRWVEPHTKTVMLGPTVKKASPALYEAARKPLTLMKMSGPVVLPRMPEVRPHALEVAKAMEARKLRLTHARREFDEGRERLRDLVDGIKAELGWDGEPHYRLTDGWLIGWARQSRFSAVRAAELAPEFGIDPDELTTMQQVAGHVVYKVIEGDAADSTEDFEGDDFAE